MAQSASVFRTIMRTGTRFPRTHTKMLRVAVTSCYPTAGEAETDPGADCSPSLAKYKPPSSREKAGLKRKAVSRQRGTGSYSQHSSVRGRRILDLYELDSSKQSRAT